MTTSETKCSQTEAPSPCAPTVRKGFGFSSKRNLLFFAKIAVSGLALWLVFRSAPAAQILALLGKGWSPSLVLAILLVVANISVQLWKWSYLLNLAQKSVSFTTVFRSLLVGFPLGFVTPGRLGELGRALYVTEIDRAQTLRLVVFDKLSNILVIVLVGIVGLLGLANLRLPFWLDGFLLVLLFTISAVGAMAIFSSRARFRISNLLRVDELGTGKTAGVFLLSLLFYAVYATQLLLLLNHFDEVAILPACQATGAVFLTKTVLPIGFGDLGIREGAAVLFFGKIGVPAAAAFNAAFSLFVLNLALPACLGVPVLLQAKQASDRRDPR